MKRLMIVIGGVIGFSTIVVEPASAGRIVGEYSNPVDINRYLSFTGALSREDSTGYLLMNGANPPGRPCTGMLIAPSWVISSAHCVDNPVDGFLATSGKFSSAGSVANITSTFIHKSYSGSTPTYFSNFPNPFGFYQNFPQRAAYDIALFKLDRNMVEDGAMIPIKPSISTPTGSFVGNFAGYGRKGDGKDQKIFTEGLTLPKSPTDSDLQAAAISDLLGGNNVIKNLSGNILYSDFDDGSFLHNIDGDILPLLSLEYSPERGDSGSGLFDDSGNLVGLVSGGGYGNKLFGGSPKSFKPFEYGSLAFYTPLSIHAGWLSNVISANQGIPSPGKPILPKGNSINYTSFSGGNLAGGLVIDDALFSLEFDLVEDTYSEVFNEQTYNSVFASNSQPVPSVPGPLPLLGVGVAFSYSRKLRRKLGMIQSPTTAPKA